MKQNRKDFLKTSGLIVAASAAASIPAASFAKNIIKNKGSKMKLRFKPYTLELKHVFTVAVYSRTTTPVMLTEIEYDGITGYGEASMPQYLGESQETAAAFLSKVNLEQFDDPFQMEDILTYVDSIDQKNTAAKASIDIALHDLVGKLLNQPWYKIWGYDKSKTPDTTFTIGIDTAEVVKQKVKEASEFKLLKVKLGKDNDKEMINTIRSVTDVPLTADANQGWTDKHQALDMINWLSDKNVLYVEQPLPKEMIDENAWITENSPIPILGDESIQRIGDLIKMKDVYAGVVIKLMKCTGMREANKMIAMARALNKKIMLGCMTETSCAISAASQLSPMVDWADLDGALLIKNDPFEGMKVIDGRVTLNDYPGIGLKS
ncbi:MAG: dipeptide epimerase [Ignavibacteriota bacterium]|jgi:L-alanine-DL-glutamate epimerase-like enolase superfamily enzyme|nr:MAG: dipeptide epimerase [Ignavibacterium sp.]MBL1155602.1 dipeptide epimerase [Ignavibacteriota bacterium]MCO6447382.1 dipeptide epimerase [Ignavibacterium album]MCZ2268508.1 dipeptide epimerase [Ignavibacteriales bacterium]MDX9713148.1 dipeptide epimerase [Ignavibacteriaceae bacterium]